jgi:Holliday junction resolvase
VPNTSRQGRDVEHAARRLLTEAGYWTHRSAGSKSAVDIIAMKPGQVLFVQAKRSGTLGPAEWNELWRLSVQLGAVAILARRKGPRTASVEFMELTAPKDGTQRRQPMVPFVLDEPGEAP